MGANSYYDAEHIFKVLKSHDQEHTLHDLLEIRKQSALEEAEEPVDMFQFWFNSFKNNGHLHENLYFFYPFSGVTH
jgi:hypothetical protein